LDRAFVSWSGGKDSCLAMFLAVKSGIEVSYLLNMAFEDNQYSRTHHLPLEVLELQAKALRIPLFVQTSTDSMYEENFLKAMIELKAMDIDKGIFGDIDIVQHRDWVERICKKGKIYPYLPLWGRNQVDVLKEFINTGFKAIVTIVRADVLGREWLGRIINEAFLEDIEKLNKNISVTICGEAGEYHTLVTDGPCFYSKIEIQDYEATLHNGYWFMNIKKCSLFNKGKETGVGQDYSYNRGSPKWEK